MKGKDITNPESPVKENYSWFIDSEESKLDVGCCISLFFFTGRRLCLTRSAIFYIVHEVYKYGNIYEYIKFSLTLMNIYILINTLLVLYI